MDIKTISVAFVAIMVGAVAFVAMLPIFQDVTATEDTYTNEGYFFMEKIPTGTAINVVWDYTKPTVLTVNGVDVAMPDNSHMSTVPFTIFCCDNWYLRYGYDTAYYVNIYQNASNTSYGGYVPDSRSLSISVTDSGVTTVNNGVEHTWPNATGDFYIISSTGDYVMKKMDKDAYVNGDSPILGYGRTYARSYNYTSHLTGSVNDGIVGEYYPESTIASAGWTISDVTLNSVTIKDHVDLYTISSMTYVITGENIQPYTAVFSQYIIPAEVTAERAIHGDSEFNTIVNLIPLVIGMGLLLIAVWWFVVRKF